MNWLNIQTSTLDSEAFVGSDPVARATWLCLLRYCAGQENGGRIAGAAAWTDRKWQQVVRVRLREIRRKCGLWSWDGDDLVVWEYPVEREAEVRANRENGACGGRPRNHVVSKSKTQTKPGGSVSRVAIGNQVANPDETARFEIAETERKGIGIGKEGEGKGTGTGTGGERARAREATPPPAPAPAPDGEGFGGLVNGGDMARAHDWVAGLFGGTCLSAAELDALSANARVFLDLAPADIRLVEEFQRVPRARLDKAEAWHRPDKCLFWIRDFPEVLRSARRWRDKHGPAARGRRPAPAPMPPGFPAYLREIGHPSATEADHEWQTNPRAAKAYRESLATTTP